MILLRIFFIPNVKTKIKYNLNQFPENQVRKLQEIILERCGKLGGIYQDKVLI